MELPEMHAQAMAWTAEKLRGAANRLDAPTPCDEWNVRTLVSHIIETQNYFCAKARGLDAPLPAPDPVDLVGDDPVGAFEKVRNDTVSAFAEPGAADKAGIGVGIAFTDSLIHGWDIAIATGQDATMPDTLARGAYEFLNGRFSAEQRAGLFKAEVPVADDASAQEKLLGFTGRKA
jgi:uncharacterized protein (TIGR03086 family)